MKVLLLSAYHAHSHKLWCEGIINNLSDFEFTLLHLPPRHFAWRVRGNPLTWISQNKEDLNQNYDLIFATSMVDLATLKGIVPNLALVPSILYFHENQFAYPTTALQQSSLEAQMVSVYSSLAASWLVFNSQFNQNSFFEGLKTLFKKLPDKLPGSILQDLKKKASVLPVPLFFEQCDAIRPKDRFGVVWNHRWEYDKGPELLLQVLEELNPDLALTVHVVGQQFRNVPCVFPKIKSLLEDRGWLGEWGFLDDREAYNFLLNKSHIVLSTAAHDFQGLAIMEAVSFGCVPVLPNRLAYCEYFEDKYRYSEIDEAASAAKLIENFVFEWRQYGCLVAPDLSSMSWGVKGPQYRELLLRFGGG